MILLNLVLDGSEKVADFGGVDEKVAWVVTIHVCLDWDKSLGEVVHNMQHYVDADDSVAVAHDSQMLETSGLAGPLFRAAAAREEVSCLEVLL